MLLLFLYFKFIYRLTPQPERKNKYTICKFSPNHLLIKFCVHENTTLSFLHWSAKCQPIPHKKSKLLWHDIIALIRTFISTTKFFSCKKRTLILFIMPRIFEWQPTLCVGFTTLATNAALTTPTSSRGYILFIQFIKTCPFCVVYKVYIYTT